MPPLVALLGTVFFISVLFWRDRRWNGSWNPALWLPFTWIIFIATRFPGQWLALFGVPVPGGAEAGDGSPFDAVFFLGLIALGIRVLLQRGFQFGEFFSSNVWLVLFFGYSFLAILWSDFPFVAFKRWIKILGHPVMALVVLTDPDPVGAIRRVLKRCAFLLIPLSVLFIKYIPEIGRGFDSWTGAPMNRGAMHNKNELGYNCLIFGLLFVWNFLLVRKLPKSASRREELWLSAGFLGMIFWLLSMADSATSLLCLGVGTLVLLVLNIRIFPRRYFGLIAITVTIVFVVLESTFHLKAVVFDMLGRNASLTDRTEVWNDVLAYPINPLLGAGFESFWLGDRIEVLWAKWWWRPNQAHNGYIETYINLGLIGIVLLAGWIIGTYRGARATLLRESPFGGFRMAFLCVMLVYNYTEAAFKAVHFMWTVFHLVSIDYTVATRTVRSLSSRLRPGGEAGLPVAAPPSHVR